MAKAEWAPPAPRAAPAKSGEVAAEPAGDAAAQGLLGAAAGQTSYEGLPARIQIPAGARQSTFSREMLATDAPRPVVALMIAARILSAVSTATVLLFLAVALLVRRDLAAGFRTIVTRVRGAGAAVTSAG